MPGSCAACSCRKPPIVKPCYKQPKIPNSYAPLRTYCTPNAPVESCTTYKLSYLPVDGCSNLRSAIRKPCQSLVLSCEPMEDATVHQLSFLPNPVCMPQPVRPRHHDMWGRGPMQNVTTQRHDFGPKPFDPRESFKPPSKMHCVETPFENRTINKLSFPPPERTAIPKSFAPMRCYEKPAAPMESCTTQKISYQCNQVKPKECIPWANKTPYQRPCHPIEGCTTYKLSYLNAGSDCRRLPITPNAGDNPVTSSNRFDSATIYNASYQPTRTVVAQPIRPVPSLVTSSAMMEGDTVQKLSFLPNPVCMPQPVRPRHHDMWGRGPMQNVTTQKHDFCPKPFDPRESFKPAPKMHCVETPFENKTINRLSFINNGQCPPPKSFKPQLCYERAATKMESCTTQKMSYQPMCTKAPERPPWGCREAYVKPCHKVEATTVYRSSFLPPGEDCTLVTDPCSLGDCTPCPCDCPGTCPPVDRCPCVCPKAAICT